MNRSRHLGRRIAGKLKRLLYLPLDSYDRLRGLRPPDRLIFTGDGSWRAVGTEFLRYFREYGKLRPDERVLDVGCGIGRMAVPLTRYLRPPGSYEGFDIVREGVAWCQESIASRHPHFRFSHSPVFNAHYNPDGTVPANRFVFPFDDAAFDFVFLTSVFTHMLPPDLEQYAGQIARVLRRGGRVFSTFFLMNDTAARGIASGESAFAFVRQPAGHYIADSADPEAAVAYDESAVRALLLRHGLDAAGPVRYGAWCGRSPHVSFQDILVATKL